MSGEVSHDHQIVEAQRGQFIAKAHQRLVISAG